MLGVKYLFIALFTTTGIPYFFIVMIGNLVNCCMRGYEAERAKLRQYLGLEWVPNGLDAFNRKFFMLWTNFQKTNQNLYDIQKS